MDEVNEIDLLTGELFNVRELKKVLSQNHFNVALAPVIIHHSSCDSTATPRVPPVKGCNSNSAATNLDSLPSRLGSPPPPPPPPPLLLSEEDTAADRDARRVDTGHTRTVCSGTIADPFFFV